MPTDIEYALMAGASYVSTRSAVNLLPAPEGWTADPTVIGTGGFEARTFRSGTEIVISYAGTDPNSIFNEDNVANAGLALGVGSVQLIQAARFYLDVRKENPGATITLTGHSLGGGLAALVGVFFGVTAVTFDQAPFAQTATFFPPAESDVATRLRNELAALLDSSGNRLYDDAALSGFTNFLALRETQGGIPNSGLVRTTRVEGEFVQQAPISIFNLIGLPPTVLDHGPYSSPSVDMHSQSLLTAFLQSTASAAAAGNAQRDLREVTKKLTDLLGLIFDSNLYSFATVSDDENFLERLVKHEAGMGQELLADAMVTRFTSDMWKLTPEGGLTLRDGSPSNPDLNEISKALMAFAMQKYYEEEATSAGYGLELFTDLAVAGTGSNGIRFDMADVSTRFDAAFAAGEKLNLTDAKGYQRYLRHYLNNTEFFDGAEQGIIRAVLPYMRDWYIQAGAGGMIATDVLNHGAFMLGGAGADALTGGTSGDLLVGNAGNDTLDGGLGNDFLLGGLGNDTYVYTGGFDTILDRDGSGSIVIGGVTLGGGRQFGDNRVYLDGNGNLYVDVGSGRWVIAGKFLIEDQQAGELGLSMTGPEATSYPPIQTTKTLLGDLKPIDDDPSTPELELRFDSDGNVVVDPGAPDPNREDTINDTFANDLIEPGGGNDRINRFRAGDDIVNLGEGDDELFTFIGATGRILGYGGPGRDYLGGGTDRDLLKGGPGADALYGNAEDDLIYGDEEGDTQAFISQGATQAGTGQQGEWVDAEDGNDKAFTGGGNDLIAGGAGDDLLVSGGGDDYVAADWNSFSNSQIHLNWTVTRQTGTNADGSTRYDFTINNIFTESDAGVGNDVVYAGAGDDAVFGERGDDVLFGEAGNDWIVGGEGHDVILGGAGQDLLNGDGDAGNGNDYLDGGTENDVLRGNDGDDILVGGADNDTLYGGSGNDVYIFNAGDGNDTVFDTKAGTNILRFGEGISSSNITLRLGSLLLDLGNGDAVHIGNFDQNDALNSSSIASFDFADGSTLTIVELLARGFDLVGTADDDVLFGTNLGDRISGLDGNDFLDGGDGDDVITGGAGLDTQYGRAGNDRISGLDGDDFLDGGDGDDTLIGGAGRDALEGGAGNDLFVAGFADGDTVVDGGGSNTLQLSYAGAVSALSVVQAFDTQGNSYLALLGGAGEQVFIRDGFSGTVATFDFGGGSTVTFRELMAQAQVAALTITGGAAGDNLIGGSGADQLSGAGGDDIIEGLGGNDTLDGGTGADTLVGGAGDDLYVVDNAADVVIEVAGEGTDTVQSSVTHALAAEVENLTLTGTGAIAGTGNALANVVTGNAAANTLDGGAGNDTLAGGFGADTYRFARGAGQDVIQETDDGSNALDEVQFAADILAADVAVTRTLNDLLLTVTATGDRLTVANYFLTTDAIVEQFRFGDGSTWDDATIAQKLSSGTPGNDAINGTAGNDVLNGLAGNDTISGANGDDRLFGEQGIDILNGNNGADILDGGLDNDNLSGGNGADTYVFARGYGQDFISETDDGTNPLDKVQFAADILAADVTARRNGFNLDITVNGTTDKVTIGGYFNNDAVGPQVVEQLRFGDGAIWDVATVKALVLVPTEGNDALTGYATNDTISGGGGNDSIDGGAGNDSLRGEAGADTLIGGLGDDTLSGGAGADLLSGGAGSDTYLFNLGDGTSAPNWQTITNDDSSTATTDRLVFGPGILPANVVVTRNGTVGDLFIGAVKISNYFASPGGPSEIDEIRFSDDPATVWTPAVVRAMLLTGNDFGNFIVGFSTDDTIDGQGGDDTLRGDRGNDTLIGGTGNDTLYGNAGADVLTGGAGNDQLNGEEFDSQFEAPGADTLDGGAGDDTLRGRRGNDVYVFGRGYGHDVVDETFAADGTDTLRLNAGVLPADASLFRHADDLVVTFAGDAAQAWITQYFTLANKPIEQIVFNDGTVWDTAAIASRVIAGTQNAQTGTAGNDTFVVDHVGDTITEGLNQGTDTVQSSVTYTLPANVENITLIGTLDVDATGNALNNVLTGNSGNNRLTGAGGIDTLIGAQGDDVLTGDGSLAGGQGNDTYVTSTGDGITENPGEGVDTVVINSTFYALGANLENLTVASNSIFVVMMVGNELDNVIRGRGTVINDSFDGGAGADVMIAQGGTFVVDNPGDQVITSTGFDTFIRSKIDWTLADDHRNLELLAGTAAAAGSGNAFNNDLVGNQNANLLSGLGGNDSMYGGTGTDTLVGGAGDDSYVLAEIRTVVSNQVRYGLNSAFSVNDDIVVEAAGQGIDVVRTLFSYALPDNVENLVLMTSTTGPLIQARDGTGNALANVITGNQAANVIDGREGADTMIGSSGNDTYYVDDAGDVVQEGAAEGTADAVIARVTYTLAGGNVEHLTLSGADAISGTGNALDNVLDGSQNSAGNVLAGGLGNDTYIVGAGDTIVENADGGIDTARSDVSFAVGANVENLVLIGTAATTGTGDALDNTLDGSQNSAANTLIGGLGNDTYLVGAGDVIVENAGEGIDTVTTAFDYTLAANVENLTLTGSALAGTGNADANVITGNFFDNVLDGAGGVDTLMGMAGNDTYVVDDAADFVDERSGIFDAGGIDTVRASVSYALGNFGFVENLVLTGSEAISGTGNGIGNRLDGSENTAANTLLGGFGDDTYVVDGLDIVVENPDEGIDTVESASTYALGAEIENLVLSGEAAIDGTGNALDNALTGNGAANVLDGGSGNDFLSGGAGNDTYRFARDAGSDTIFEDDATAGNLDTIELGIGISAADVSGARVGADLVLSIAGSSGALTLSAFFSGPNNEIERVVFADGTVWDVNALKALIAITGTSAANTLNGTAGDDRIFGLGGNDTLNGLAGNDLLDGGTGNDSMVGGAGNDTYVVDSTTDTVSEAANGGTDTVQSSVTLTTLANNVENLTLTGTNAINGTGNTLNNVLTGNIAANTLSGGTGADTLIGGRGNDTYVVDNAGDVVTENANEGVDTVQSSITYTLGATLENLTLTATTAINATGNALDNVLTGGGGNNSLTGGAGNDTLTGGAGTDTLVGGVGNDVYIVDSTTDTITEAANEGIDTVQSSVTITALANNVENLTITASTAVNGTGNTLDNVLTGGSGNNSLNGGAGNDTLTGGAGTDTLVGGAGNDVYIVDSTTDVITEAAGAGTDTVQCSVTITTLAANVENLTLTGNNAINGTGNTLNNVLTGNSAANTLNGGSGVDTLTGGLGNDTYVVDSTTDTIIEAANEGTDTVQSAVTFTLGNNNVENLTLTATTAINGTGNALDNVLTGGSGNNSLTGGAGNDTFNGGAGTDTLVGDVGNDVYIVDSTTDTITEAANEGTDTVQSSVTFTLGNNVENLTLTATTAINGTGNALDNVLTGGSGANVLNGMAGNDIYFIGTGDSVTEAVNGGEDLINSSINFTVSTNAEHLILTGTTATTGTGNGSNNLLRGNTLTNTLNGVAGNDVLEGGDGNDTLTDTAGANYFNGQAGNDTITGGASNELLAGGSGNDALNTGAGADIIAFNRGDGADTVAVSTAKDNSVSLGGGIAYADLFFQKSGNSLVLKTAGASGTEGLTFTDWYLATANRSVLTLQMVVEASADFDAASSDPTRNVKVARFDFDGLAAQFDAALAANPVLTSWALTDALVSFHLGGSDSDALGGDLAYRYGLSGNLAAVGTIGAQNVLSSAQFGADAQTFQPSPNLQEGIARLS